MILPFYRDGKPPWPAVLNSHTGLRLVDIHLPAVPDHRSVGQRDHLGHADPQPGHKSPTRHDDHTYHRDPVAEEHVNQRAADHRTSSCAGDHHHDFGGEHPLTRAAPVISGPGALATVLGQPVEPVLITRLRLFGSAFLQPLLTSPLGGALLGSQRRRHVRSGRDGLAGLA